MSLTEDQKHAIKCAHAELVGTKEARDKKDWKAHDWEGQEETIKSLEVAFPEIILEGE